MDLKNEDSIQVCIRIRPGSEQESIVQFTQTQIHLDKNHFGFDKIFPPSATQQEIFEEVGTKLIARTLDGYNGCIFVYGQTGSGKTYTMMGDGNGLMQKSFLQLFLQIEKLQRAEANIFCSYYQIYNQQIIDLLDTRKDKKMNIRQDLKKGVFVQNLIQETVTSSSKLLDCLNAGMRNRHVGETMMNRQSSRSHSIFTISFSIRSEMNGSQVIKTPKLHFVDLAGSERQKMTAASGQRLKEAGNINKSLTTLGMVINALASQKSRTHIPYRDSKLTCLLRDSLGGNSKTYLIATISRNVLCFQETLSTLNFANRAKMVKVKALVNEESLSTNIETYKQQIRKLKAEIQRLKSQKSSPVNKQIRWMPQQIQTNINYDKRFQQINDKISVISDHLIKNPSSPSLDQLIQQIKKLKSQNYIEKSEMIDESNRQIRELNQNQFEDQVQRDQQDPLIQYLSCNNSLLEKINQKIDEYVQMKSQLRNYAYNNQLAIASLKTPSKFEREQLEGIIEKRNSQIMGLHDQLRQLRQIISRQQLKIETSLNESMLKSSIEQKNYEKIERQRLQMQRQLNTLKVLSKQANEELQLINKKYVESQDQYRQTRQLYLFAEQNYETQKSLRDQIQSNLMEKMCQLQKLKVEYSEKIQEQRQYFEEMEQQLRQQLSVLTQTVEFNENLISDYKKKTQEYKQRSQQYSQIIKTLQENIEQLKIQKNQLQEDIGKLSHKTNQLSSQLNSLNNKYMEDIELKQQEIQRITEQYRKSQEGHKEYQNQLKETIMQKQKHISLLQNDVRMLNQQQTQLKQSFLSQIQILNQQYGNQRCQLEAKILQAEQNYKIQLDRIQAKRNQIEGQLERIKQDLSETHKKLVETQQTLTQTKKQAEQQIKQMYEETKTKLQQAKVLQIQNQQLKKQYKILQKESYKIKAKNSQNNNKTQQQLILKVDYYEQKFKLMSMQYQKAMQVVKRLKQKQLNQAQKIHQLQQSKKVLRLSLQNSNSSEGTTMLKNLSQQNNQLKRQLQILKQQTTKQQSTQSYMNKVSIQQEKSSLRQKQEYLKKKIQESINRWDPSKENVIKDRSLQELIASWEEIEAESCKKLDAVAKGIKKQQKLKSQNSLILKQNIYLKEQLTNLQKNVSFGLPTKRVKLDLMQIAEDSMQ